MVERDSDGERLPGLRCSGGVRHYRDQWQRSRNHPLRGWQGGRLVLTMLGLLVRRRRKDHLRLRSWSGTSHREQRLAAPLAQRLPRPPLEVLIDGTGPTFERVDRWTGLSSSGRRLLTLRPPHSLRTVAGRLGERILRLAELGPQRPATQTPSATGTLGGRQHCCGVGAPFFGSRP